MLNRNVADGSYDSIEDAVADGLRLIEDRKREHADRLADIRRRLDEAARDPVRISSDDVRRHFDRLLLEAEAKRSA